MAEIKTSRMKKAKWKIDLKERTGNCAYCELSFNHRKPHRNAGMKTIEHLIPLVNFGANNLLNCVVACEWCNNFKNDKPLEHFHNHIAQLTIDYGQHYNNRDLYIILKNIRGFINFVKYNRMQMERDYRKDGITGEIIFNPRNEINRSAIFLPAIAK